MDPKEKEKAETMDWIQHQIRSLNEEVDRSEMHMESLATADIGKGKRAKKEDSKSKNERERRTEMLRRHLDRINFHIEKLEVIHGFRDKPMTNGTHSVTEKLNFTLSYSRFVCEWSVTKAWEQKRCTIL